MEDRIRLGFVLFNSSHYGNPGGGDFVDVNKGKGASGHNIKAIYLVPDEHSVRFVFDEPRPGYHQQQDAYVPLVNVRKYERWVEPPKPLKKP